MDRLKQRERIHLVLKKLKKSLKDSPKMHLLKIILWEIGHLLCSESSFFFNIYWLVLFYSFGDYFCL